MYRDIVIDGNKTPMIANGLTPILYKQVFRRSVFGDFADAQKTNASGKTETDAMDMVEVGGRLAYLMSKQAEKVDLKTLCIEGYYDYLSALSPMAIPDALNDIIEFYADNNKTESNAKKK